MNRCRTRCCCSPRNHAGYSDEKQKSRRFPFGRGSAAFGCLADVVEVYRDRVTAYGLNSAALAGAGVLAGVLAATVGGIALLQLFAIDAATCVVCAALVVVGLRPRATPSTDTTASAGQGTSERSPWRDPLLLGMLLIGTGFAVLYLQSNVALPLTLTANGLRSSPGGALRRLRSHHRLRAADQPQSPSSDATASSTETTSADRSSSTRKILLPIPFSDVPTTSPRWRSAIQNRSWKSSE